MAKAILKKRIRLISLLTVAVFVYIALLSSFHYHEGGKKLDTCPVCKFQLYNYLAKLNGQNDAAVVPKSVCQYFEIEIFHIDLLYRGFSFNAHAPPASL